MEKSHFLQRFLMGTTFAVITIWGMFNVFVTNSYRLSAVDESGAIGGGVSVCEESDGKTSASDEPTETDATTDAADDTTEADDNTTTEEKGTADTEIDCEGDSEEKPIDEENSTECEDDESEEKPDCEEEEEEETGTNNEDSDETDSNEKEPDSGDDASDEEKSEIEGGEQKPGEKDDPEDEQKPEENEPVDENPEENTSNDEQPEEEKETTQIVDYDFEQEKPSMDVVTVIAETTNKPSVEEKPVAETGAEEIVNVIAVTTTRVAEESSEETLPTIAQDVAEGDDIAEDTMIFDALDNPMADEEPVAEITADETSEEFPAPRIAAIVATAMIAGGIMFLWVRKK